MCDENTDKGHKTCLVKTNSIYKPVVSENDRYFRRTDPDDAKEVSNAFIYLTDFDPVIKEENGKKIRVGRFNDDNPSETKSDTGSYGSRGIIQIFSYTDTHNFFKKGTKLNFIPNIYND